MGWDFLAWLLPMLLAALLLSAGIEDARTRLIANWKSIAIALGAPVWWAAIGVDPWPGMAMQVGVAIIVFALFCVAFHFGQMGGGDVKLIGALALWLPLSPLMLMLLVMSIAGGAITLLVLVEARIRRSSAPIEVPYGVAIALAGLVSLGEPLLNHFS